MRLRIAWIGKTKHPATTEWTADYLRRIRRFMPVAADELTGKDPDAALLRQPPSTRLFLLEPGGRALDSAEFARWLERLTHDGSRDVMLVVGGADGFSAPVRERAAGSLSLSRLTLSHELARIILLEQVYRALALLHHHPYPH